jgi:sugar O-acyltransferase (sialic acid O-acetyltransferase NeuD family)
MPFAVIIPLINPNEPEALLVSVNVTEGQWVEQDQVLCTLETTKSTVELTAERPGFVAGIQHTVGDSLAAGKIFGYILDSEDQELPVNDAVEGEKVKFPTDLRITQPARELVEAQKIDLNLLPRDRLVTRELVLQIMADLAAGDAISPVISDLEIDTETLILYGGGGHAKMLIELLQAGGRYRVAGILDDGLPVNTQVLGIPVIGGEGSLPSLFRAGIQQAVNAVGGIGNIHSRIRVSQKLKAAGFHLPAVWHPSAWIERSANLSPGAQVFARAYIGAETRLGEGTIASTGCIISHDCILEDYAIVSPGAILAGEVRVGARSLIGMGATINLRVQIGAGAKIGNSATIKEDVPAGWVIQAGTTWPGQKGS